MNAQDHDPHAVSGTSALRLLAKYVQRAIKVALAAALLVAVPGFVYVMWIQPVRQTTFLEFRPTFTGARQMLYPNKLPFSPTDVTAASVLDHVFDRNEIKSFCDREVFRSGFFVEQRSDQSVMLDLEYQARLSEPRITPVERRVAQEEYVAKRMALPLQFRLVFVTPSACAGLPDPVIAKVMIETLEAWATESESMRGVLNHQVEVLTPGTLDVALGGSGGWVLRADLLRTALGRIIDNIDSVSALPGAGLVRMGKERLTFLEVRGKLVDLMGARLEPLVMTSGRSLVKESLVWVTETVASAERDQQIAEGLAAAQRNALREYSGVAQAVDVAGYKSTEGTNNTGMPSMPTQLDRSFVDRIVEMSGANVAFRRQLTEAMVKAASEAVTAQKRASYYRRLLQSLRESGAAQMPPDELDKRLDEIVLESKALTKQFNDLYDEFSRVSLRSSSSLYQTDKPVTTEMNRRYTLNWLGTVIASVFVAVLVLAAGIGLARDPRTRPIRASAEDA